MNTANIDSETPVPGRRASNTLVWLELLKGAALLWIFLNHVSEMLLGSPYIANPSPSWPPLSERLAQLAPLTGYGIWTLPLNLLRYVGWSGDQGVQLFLIASGFGLTWGLLSRQAGAPLNLGKFYWRRFERIYPLWWAVHLLFLLAWLLTGWGLAITDRAFYFSLLGLRMAPGTFYYFAPAWWYIGLLVQLYLVYPLVWEALRRWGPGKLLAATLVVALPIRAAGLLLLSRYVDQWQRGAIFITRLPEFVLGVALAAWMYSASDQTDRWLRAPRQVIGALGLYAAGTVLSLSLAGMTLAPFLLGVGAFGLLYPLLRRLEPLKVVARIGVWIGRHSYSLFLLHHPFLMLLLPQGLTASPARLWGGVIAAAALTVGAALALEWGVNFALARLTRWHKQVGLAQTGLRVAALAAVCVAALLGGDLAVRQFAPQEVLGWGERPSLESDTDVGWRLIPNRQTRLRWASYDYTVTANALGFPGPDYAEPKAAGTLRIMTTGDAFTSAEGVDTNQAWPRLLETNLATQLPDRKVEVLNFAITGYGPNQYAAAVEKFGPRYHPDLIVMEFFVNDFQDVLWSNADFQTSIGFGLPASNSWYELVRFGHLRRFFHLEVMEPLREALLGEPRPNGYFLGNFAALERNHPEIENVAQPRVAERLGQIKAVADQIGARILIVMVPASVQVCQPAQLAYYPRHVDLTDSNRFDVDLPQRTVETQARSLGIDYYDLRPVLRAVPGGCPYQQQNMHWLASGHQAVAAYVAKLITTGGYLQGH